MNILAMLTGNPAAATAYNSGLSPEANAFVGARPAAPKVETFQRPKGLRNTIGQIADALAVLGGQTPAYSTALSQQEATFVKKQKENVIGAYLANPRDAEAAAMAARVAPAEYVEVLKLTKPSSTGSMPREVVIANMIEDPNTPPNVRNRLIELASRPETRPQMLATERGYVPAAEAEGLAPYRAPPAPAAPPNWQTVQDANGNYVQVNPQTGQTRPLNLQAPPKGASGGRPAKEDQTAPEVVLPLISQARGLLKRASGSGVSSAANKALQFVGVSTDATKANEALGVIGGRLTATSPRFEGPQGVLDVKLYEKMAGRVADDTLPVNDRLAALKELETIVNRNRTRRAGGGGATGGTTVSAGGKTYTFPNAQAAAEFKRRAGIQ